MSEQPPKPWYLQLPAKIVGVVVFLVALTTLIGNLMEIDEKRRTQAQISTSAPAAAPIAEPRVEEDAPPAAGTPASQRLELRLDRIVVRRDGTVGTTDWRFAVEGDGQPLFVFSQDDLDDTGGRNVALPRDARTRLRLAEGGKFAITVKGWRGSRFRLPSAEPDAVGEGSLAGDGIVVPIVVAAKEPEAGEFVFQFSATRVE